MASVRWFSWSWALSRPHVGLSAGKRTVYARGLVGTGIKDRPRRGPTSVPAADRIIRASFWLTKSNMSTLTEKPKRLIIDTDAGIDDAQAILMALAHPELAEVVAITTCHGNTSVDHTSRNVLRLLKVAGRLDIPVFKGASKALIGGDASATHYHGLDGFGDVPDPEAPGLEMLQSEHAVNALVRMVKESPGEFSLVSLAPQTNIALALRLDPDFGKKLKECFIMGGNYEAKGNVTTNAEFNFHADPEAAHVTLGELGCPITMACWELCLKYSFSWETYEEMRKTPTKKRQFLKLIEGYTVRTCKKLNWETYIPCDELAMAAALCGDVVIKGDHVTCDVELQGRHSRGQVVVDWTGRWGQPANVHLIRELNLHRYTSLINKASE